MPTKMKSFRMSDREISNLEYLSAFFDCSQADLIDQLISYAVTSLEYSLDSHVPTDLIKDIALDCFGYKYMEKLIENYK